MGVPPQGVSADPRRETAVKRKKGRASAEPSCREAAAPRRPKTWVLIAVTMWAATVAIRAFTNIDAWDLGWFLWLLAQDFLAGCIGVLTYILSCKDD